MNEQPNPYESTPHTQTPVTEYERNVRQWAMFIHFSTLAGFVVPVAGWILPIVLWQIKKDEMPEIDVHGKVVANWLITSLIYIFISILLVFVAIGIPLLILFPFVSAIFSIIGGIKANSGEVWDYPLNIKFF